MKTDTMTFKQPDEKEFEQVKSLVEEFWLDNENLQPQQFRVISDNGKVIAFGRLRENVDATELCSLGVAKDFRGQAFGEKMVKALLEEAKMDVYIVTVIPAFFEKLGFTYEKKYPASMQKKVDLCTTHYHVGEPYRVMKWGKKQI